MNNARLHLFDLTLDDLKHHMKAWGLPTFRAKQIMHWVYEKNASSFYEMTNLSKADQAAFDEKLQLTTGSIIRQQNATDGVQKLLMNWNAGETNLPVIENTGSQTECVMIPANARKTACISSQMGCPVGCRFCASGLGGLDGNLTAGQIVEQVWQLSRVGNVGRMTHVVFMGVGEPMANFDQVARAIQLLNADWGLNISGRRITVSTVGLPAQIRRLADVGVPVTLAISLHAPNDRLRRELIPWAQYVTIDQLLDAGRHYFNETGREITLEYILLGNVNDQPKHAQELITVARKLRANINLIRYNEVASLPYRRPTDEAVFEFQSILKRGGVNTHIRASRGRDIAAACGQLRHEFAQANEQVSEQASEQVQEQANEQNNEQIPEPFDPLS